jgi:hypothetical protein
MGKFMVSSHQAYWWLGRNGGVIQSFTGCRGRNYRRFIQKWFKIKFPFALAK